MTDNEIIKTLENCIKQAGDCENCPSKNYCDDCSALDRVEDVLDLINRQKADYDHLLKIARKMHTWIFLNTIDEQAAYDEIGLSIEDNRLLGSIGEIMLVKKEQEE